MTIPSRPAPPPPNKLNSYHQQNNASSATTTTSMVNNFVNHKKAAPPRPPPPKAPVSTKKIGILSNIFGSSNKSKSTTQETQHKVPPKLPAPPVVSRTHQIQQNHTSIQQDFQLINFETPSTLKKTNTGGSDSVSIDSFCSSTSSPNNLGGVSQSESGFEDDFSVSDFKVSSSAATSRSTTFSSDPFDCFEDFSTNKQPLAFQQPTNIRNLKPTILPKPCNVGNANFFTSSSTTSSSTVPFDDTLSNGKSLIKPAIVSMPTIIKPVSVKGKSSPTHIELKKTETIKEIPSVNSFDDSDVEPESPPMPTIPPPPPPSYDAFDEVKEPYAIALFDFESEVEEDLNFRADEKIYLIKQMNDEWMFGKNRRGCEGIFPVSYVDIRVPISKVEPDSGTASRSESVSPAVEGHRVNVLYTFNAETADDLNIVEGEIVNVIYEITPEWLYGTNERGEYGQFPSNYIEYIPQNLQQMPK